jgi:hypothetical protein
MRVSNSWSCGDFTAEVAQQGAERDVIHDLAGFRPPSVQIPCLPHLVLRCGAGRRLADLEQEIAQQALGNAVRGAGLMADFLAQTGAKLFDADLGGGQVLMGERIKEGLCNAPERVEGGARLEGFQRDGGIAHGVRPGAVTRCPEPLQQAPLQCRTGPAQRFDAGGRVGFGCVQQSAAWQSAAEVGVEQIGGADIAVAAGMRNFAIEREESQGLITRAPDEFSEIVRDGRAAAASKGGLGRIQRNAAVRQTGQQAVEGVGEVTQAVQSDHGQRPSGLMQVRAGERNLAGLLGIVLGTADGFGRERQRLIDLTPDPGKRADVQFLRLRHELASFRP